MGKSYFYYLFLLLLVGIGFGCKDDEGTKHDDGQTSTFQRVSVPSFNPDSAYQYVQKQVDFGPRVPNTKQHDACGDYLIEKLKSLGLQVEVQSFEAKAYDGTMLKLRNIIGKINPEASLRVLLSAHWDTRPFADQDTVNQKKPIDGANDGGSGVGVLLEVARIVTQSKDKPTLGIDIIFFDGEDYGAPADFAGDDKDTYCLGSQYWAKNKKDYSAYFGILLDMVGAKGATFAREGVSMQYAPTIVDMVWGSARVAGYSKYFIDYNSGAITDDHYYINEIAKIPTIDIIEYQRGGDRYFGDYWHTHADNMSVISKETLKAVGQTLLEVLYNGHKQI